MVERALLEPGHEGFDWRALEELFFADDDTSGEEVLVRGRNGVNVELFRLKSRLRRYYALEAGAADEVEIAIAGWSDAPWSKRPHITPRVQRQLTTNPELKKWMLLARLHLDRRTFAGDLRALDAATKASLTNDPNTLPFLMWTMFAVRPRTPVYMNVKWLQLEARLGNIVLDLKNAGFDHWELEFVDACRLAVYDHRWREALDRLTVINEKSRGEAVESWWYPALLASVGEFGEAERAIRNVLESAGRRSLGLRLDLALILLLGGSYDAAREELEIAAAVHGNDLNVATHLALVFEAIGEYERAVQMLAPFINPAEDFPTDFKGGSQTPDGGLHSASFAVWGLVCGRAGVPWVREKVFDHMLERRKGGSVVYSAMHVALVAAGLGLHDDVVDYLRVSVEDEADPMMMWMHLLPAFRDVRRNRAFKRLTRSLGLPRLNS